MLARCTLLAVAAVTLMAPRLASACGGGLVARTVSTVMDAQRVFVSIRGGKTEIVTQVTVPESREDFGVLIPVPSMPELDPAPVPSEALDSLEAQTRPRIFKPEPGGCDGIGCGAAASKGAVGAPDVMAGRPVEIGPVTAVVLTAESGEALNAWLAASGFTLDATGRALVTEYTSAGRAFIALKRSVSAPTSVATSVGVHFTLLGDQRTLPLRFARIGAASTVAFTVFVFTADRVGPAAPFAAVTLDQLDTALVDGAGYAKALEVTVAEKDGRAFVIEGSRPVNQLGLASALSRLVDPQAVMTRLSTIIAVGKLNADAHLDGPSPSTTPDHIQLPASAATGAALLLVAVGLRLRRRQMR